MLLGLGGAIGSGKTTAADWLESRGAVQRALADPLKEMCRIGFGLSREQLYGSTEDKAAVDERWGVSPRQILQMVGTELFRERLGELVPQIGSEFWVRSFQVWYGQFRKEHPETLVVLSDVRFPNEEQMVHRLGGETILIQRDSVGNGTGHVSETSSASCHWDHVVINNGTLDELYNKLEDLV